MSWTPTSPTEQHHGRTHGAHGTAAGIGLLPLPLEISAQGFAWSQGSAIMIALTVACLAFGIAMNIGLVVISMIAARRTLGAMLIFTLPRIEHWTCWPQGVAGVEFIGSGPT